MISAVDTNILLDIIIPNQSFLKSSLEKLESTARKSRIIICEIVYSELASQFQTHSELNTFLNDTHIEIVWSNNESLFLASRLWLKYREKRPEKIYCSDCGKQMNTVCPHCGSQTVQPRRMLNDFIIGSHAITFADLFITRDLGFYKRYFSGIKIL